MTREEAYDEVARIAAEHALIAQGFGGVLTIVHPETQREHGIEAKCLYMASQGPWPERQAEESKADNWPKLTQDARVGATTFHAGVSARLVIERAYREHEYAKAPPFGFTPKLIEEARKAFGKQP